MEKRTFSKKMQTLNRNGAHSNEKEMMSSLQEGLVFLLSVLLKDYEQYSKILKTLLDEVLSRPKNHEYENDGDGEIWKMTSRSVVYMK